MAVHTTTPDVKRYLDDVLYEAYERSCLHGDAAVEAESQLPVDETAAYASTALTVGIEAQVLSLSGTWQMKGNMPPVSEARRSGWPPQPRVSVGVHDGWHKPGFDRSDWLDVSVPTSVQNALIEQGKLDDPFWNTNTYDELNDYGTPETTHWHFRKTRIEQQEWWFARTFDVPADWQGRTLRLYFDGIDYSGSFYLNGYSLGHHKGMFGGPAYDVSRIIRFDQPNELVVRIDPAPDTWWGSLKGSPGWGWHYGHLISLGIWRDVRLEVVPEIELRSPFVRTEALENGAASLVIEYYLDNNTSSSAPVVVSGTIAGKTFSDEPIHFESTVSAQRGRSRVRTAVRVDHPRLWWPHGYGEQPLYTLALAAAPVDSTPTSTVTATFGIRTIEMEPVNGLREDVDYRWQFVVNGRRLFVKGCNWCWADPMLQGKPDLYEHLLEMAHRANIQLLRAWGGGIIEIDAFYEKCDEKGIMVYQEFPFCWGPPDFPITDSAMLDQQVSQVVKRLRNHPALIMWGGGNENEAAYGADDGLFLVGRRCRQYDPSRPYHRTSPWGGSRHNYFAYHTGEPLDSAYRSRPAVLYGEFGFPSMPNRSSTLRFLPAEALEQWPPDETSHGVLAHMHQFALRDFVKALRYCDYGAVRDWNTYIEYSQMAQGDAIRFGAEMLRGHAYDTTTGVWFYKLTELFPGHSWGILDFYGEPKLSYYRAKQVYRRQSAFATYEKFDWADGEPFAATLHVANDTPQPLDSASVTATIFGSTLGELWSKTYSVPTLVPDSRIDIDSISLNIDPAQAKPFLLAVTMRAADGTLLSDQWYWFNFKAKTDMMREIEQTRGEAIPGSAELIGAYMDVPEARLLTLPRTVLQAQQRAGQIAVTNTGGLPAFNVIIDGFPDGYENFLGDNSFCLRAGEERVIAYEVPEGVSLDSLTVRAWNAPPVNVPS